MPRTRFRRLVFAWKAFCFTLGTLVLAAIAVQLWFFSQVLYWNRFEPATSSFMDRRLDEMRQKNPRARLRHRWVAYERISPHLKRATERHAPFVPRPRREPAPVIAQQSIETARGVGAD